MQARETLGRVGVRGARIMSRLGAPARLGRLIAEVTAMLSLATATQKENKNKTQG